MSMWRRERGENILHNRHTFWVAKELCQRSSESAQKIYFSVATLSRQAVGKSSWGKCSRSLQSCMTMRWWLEILIWSILFRDFWDVCHFPSPSICWPSMQTQKTTNFLPLHSQLSELTRHLVSSLLSSKDIQGWPSRGYLNEFSDFWRSALFSS